MSDGRRVWVVYLSVVVKDCLVKIYVNPYDSGMPLKCEKLCSLGSLSSKFSDLKVIAGGGGGVVLSGVDKSLSEGQLVDKENTAVALKRLSLVGKGHCRVALRELRLLKRFKHENVVKTIKITDSSGSTIEDPSMENFKDLDAVYVVEELLDSDLHKIIESNGRLPLETTKLFLYQLLRGLKYIHSANVIHRDIKPGNLFVNVNDLTLKVGDYGLARVFDKTICPQRLSNGCCFYSLLSCTRSHVKFGRLFL